MFNIDSPIINKLLRLQLILLFLIIVEYFPQLFKYLLIKFILNKFSFNDSIWLNKLIILDGVVDLNNFLSFNIDFYFLDFFLMNFLVAFREDSIDSKEDFPKDTLH